MDGFLGVGKRGFSAATYPKDDWVVRRGSPTDSGTVPPMFKTALGVLLAAGLSLGAVPLGAQSAAPAASSVGEWSTPTFWNHTAIHAILLPTGDVMTIGLNNEAIWLWDPETGARSHVRFDISPDSLFCATHTYLPDGRVFLIGGHSRGGAQEFTDQDVTAQGQGSALSWVYDAETGDFLPGPKMAAGRWYASAVAMADGSTLVVGGTTETKFPNFVPELASPAMGPAPPGAWAELPQAQMWGTGDQINYLRLHLMANGRVLFAGPVSFLRELDPVTFTWDPMQFSSASGMPFKDWGTYLGKRSGPSVLLSGAERMLVYGGHGVDATTAQVITTYDSSRPSVASSGSLSVGRSNSVPVLLPDGTVLAVGGEWSGNGFSRTPEVYDPATGAWTQLASQAKNRAYHSTALLLPDGRVLSAGGSDGDQGWAEVFSPPYLFKGAAPVIESSPSSLGYGATGAVAVDDGAVVDRVTLVRLGSTTHGLNFEQRHVELAFSVDGDVLTITAPSDRNVAPPGVYMLFVLNGDGVPSKASMLRLTWPV